MKYAITIFYSEEDEGYIAIVPDLPLCSAFGETEEEALKEIKIAQEGWIEVAKMSGKKIPEPSVLKEDSSFNLQEVLTCSDK
ncbi:MAG: type II toxin-antitoxin system HicB family antitoxin [Nitrospirae bacterium]|uniref:type II toxin-antitoxin system HicB family antitoxin n=1 Tax=Candidatus Magnetobacterium casense TaxID=1455061 RepID=UPI00059036E8|nr:type II toxin-antitoxin system HicB family antitoxin [Candidatus Magnetobacterium casensis]MBF0338040.1 type II toxin-antitoxin system HicB family antitoxin [Nitrospirota bacterium]